MQNKPLTEAEKLAILAEYPETVNVVQAAEIIAKFTGKPISRSRVTHEAYVGHLKAKRVPLVITSYSYEIETKDLLEYKRTPHGPKKRPKPPK
jgi:hypothetical protein